MTSRGHHAKAGLLITPEIKALAEELRQERQKIRQLRQSMAELEASHGEEEEQEEEEPQEPLSAEDKVWKKRYETQVDANNYILSQIEKLRESILAKKEEIKEVSSGGGIQNLKQSDLKKKIIQLQRQKNNLESQMKDYEWRIDKEAELYHKANEKKKALGLDVKRNPKTETHKPARPMKPLTQIKRESLARGSYVQKLMERKASRLPNHHRDSLMGETSGVGSAYHEDGMPSTSHDYGNAVEGVHPVPRTTPRRVSIVDRRLPTKLNHLRLKAEETDFKQR